MTASGLRLALATSRPQPDLTPDDALLGAALLRRRVEWHAVRWDDEGVDWSRFQGVLVRSTWDYHLRLPEFLAWTTRLEQLSVPLWNPAELIRWNARKHYLRELEEAGVPIVPTRWIACDDTRPLAAHLHDAAWTDAVVKPVVSASAHGTWRTSPASALEEEPRFRELLSEGDLMLQPYLSNIESRGEWSLVFLDGNFSHAALKLPRAGDFRVQHQFGGTRRASRPEERLLESAWRVLEAAPVRPVYARVDGCIDGGQFLLMELELIEPELFFGLAPGSADRLADLMCGRGGEGCPP